MIFLEKNNEISKNNAMLIRNLLEISTGKRASVTGPKNMRTPTSKVS